MSNKAEYITTDDKHRYYFRMLNFWHDELEPRELLLLMHYARIGGEKGQIWEGIEATKRKLKMGGHTIRDLRKSLRKKGIIRVYRPREGDYESSIMVEVNYDWDYNFAKYAGQRDTSEAPATLINPVSGQEMVIVADDEDEDDPCPVGHTPCPAGHTPQSEQADPPVRLDTKEDSSKKTTLRTPPPSTNGPAQPTLIRPTSVVDNRARQRREVEEVRVTDVEGKIKTPLTSLELFILQTTGQKQIADSYREKLSQPVAWYDETGLKLTESPSPNELYETDEAFRRFVSKEIVLKLKNGKAQRFNAKGFTDWLCGAGTYSWFFTSWRDRNLEREETSAVPGTPTLTEEQIRQMQEQPMDDELAERLRRINEMREAHGNQ